MVSSTGLRQVADGRGDADGDGHGRGEPQQHAERRRQVRNGIVSEPRKTQRMCAFLPDEELGTVAHFGLLSEEPDEQDADARINYRGRFLRRGINIP